MSGKMPSGKAHWSAQPQTYHRSRPSPTWGRESNVPVNENDISKKDFAIIVILNGKQVPLKIDNQKKLIHYGKLNAKEQVVICAEIEPPIQNISNFYLLLIK